MKLFLKSTLLLLSLFFLTNCEKSEDKTVSQNTLIQDVVKAIDCKIVDTGSTFPLETLDRNSYSPLSYEIANIHINKKLDGYHGPTTGKYIIAIEEYSTKDKATKRADEYKDLSRLALLTEYDENELSKMTVRCWGFSSGKKVYLLTTLAAQYSALESRTKFVINGIKSYESTQTNLEAK